VKTAVVAIGGNAILRSGERGTVEEQRRNIRETARHLADMIGVGYDIVVTHGNGPQVGAILLQNEAARDRVPPMPLDVCGAESQGLIGYLLQQELTGVFRERGMPHTAVSLITQVVVREDDPAFKNPTKFIGPFYTREESKVLSARKGWVMREDPRGGYRRVVPSPEPVDIVEKEAIKRLVFGDGHHVVIAAGGGGVPVVERDGRYVGVEAVVDKDLASSVLATAIGEKFFIILTDVPYVYTGFGTENEREIGEVSLEEIEDLYEKGEFPPGSMGPKILAAIRFLRQGGESVLITSPEELLSALDGGGGTWIRRR